MKLLADNAIKGYETSIADADKKKSDILTQKQSELDALTREIERLKQVRHDQIIQSTKQIGGYILVFVAIYCAKIITLGMFKRFGR